MKGFLGSLVPAVLLLVGFMAVAGLLSTRYQGGVGVAVGIVAGASLALGLLLGYWISTDWLNLRHIRRRAREGDTTLRDGEVAAFQGVVRTDGEPLTAPFSDGPCAAYTYVVATSRASTATGGSNRVVLAQGFHMVKTRIEGARRSLRLGSLPGFEDDLRQNTRGGPWGIKAQELMERLSGRAGSASERERQVRLLDARHNEIDEVHQDYCLGAAPEHGDAVVVDEEVLTVGQEVCVVGTYDAGRDALTAHRPRLGHNLIVYRGSAEEVRSRVGRETAGFAKAVAVLVGLGGLLLGLPFLPAPWTVKLPIVGPLIDHSSPPIEETREAAAASLDAAHRERINGRVREEHLAGNSARALELAIEQDAYEGLQWLIDRGIGPATRMHVHGDSYQLPLVAAARRGQLETVRTLLRAGADPNETEPTEVPGETGRTALEESLLIGRCDIADLLMKAGARPPRESGAYTCP